MIQNKVDECFEKLIKEYGENRIFFCAGVGPYAYGIDNSNDKPTIAACYLPTEEQLYLSINNPIISINQDILLIDIRIFMTLFKENNKILKEMFLSKYIKINDIYEKEYHDLFLNKELLFLLENKDNVLKIFKENIIRTIKKSFNIPSNETLFIHRITSTEKKVLNIIINELNDKPEGDIIISQLINKYNISRPVFTSLFYKLKNYNIATIDNRGVKGAHIIFNNLNILKDTID